MGTDYRINGQGVTPEEWERLRAYFSEEPEVSQAFEDRGLSEQELTTLLDTDRDGRIDFDDFEGKTGLARFEGLSDILVRHGFNLPEKIVSARSLYEHEVQRRLWSSGQFVLAAVKQSGWALEYADPELRKDREIVLTAVKQSGWALQFADPELRKDREIVLAAVKQSGWALQFANPELRKDREITKGFAQNIGVTLTDLPPPLQEDAFQAILSSFHWDEVLPPEANQNYSSWRDTLKSQYNIEFLKRFRSFVTLYAVLQQRKDPDRNADKPLAIVMTPKEDWNGAFDLYPVSDRLTELGYAVAYHEAGNEDEVLRSLQEATRNGQRKASLILFAGHGSATTLALGGKDRGRAADKPVIRDEKLYLDTSDFQNPPEIPLADFIRLDGNIVLYSCSNAEGREANQNNLANVIAKTLPKEVLLHASDRSTNIVSLDLVDGKLIVEWTRDSLYTLPGRQ